VVLLLLHYKRAAYLVIGLLDSHILSEVRTVYLKMAAKPSGGILHSRITVGCVLVIRRSLRRPGYLSRFIIIQEHDDLA
jgi:hypothetical protein